MRLPLAEDPAREEEIRRVLRRARGLRIGILLFADHPEAGLGRRQSVNVWIRDQSPAWEISMRLGNLDMSLLVGHLLSRAWDGEFHVISVVEDPDKVTAARRFLESVTDLARLPEARVRVRQGELRDQIPHVPTADLDIFGLADEPDFGFARDVLRMTRSSCLFVRDSGEENVLA